MRRAIGCLLASALGCSSPGPAPATDRASGSAAPSSAAPSLAASAGGARPAPPPALEGAPVRSLDVAGHDPAIVAVPIGARDRRPLVVATHGNYDRPEWQCEVWSTILRGRAFVLCPRGVARPDSPSSDDVRFTYADNRALEREVDAALSAARAADFAPWIADGPPVWAGFSLGAIMGVAIAKRRPADFPALILVEGGVDRFGDDVARAFAEGGGKRVLFACAQQGCARPAAERAKRLEARGIAAAVVDAGPAGHTYDGPVADAVTRALPGFFAPDERFAPVFAEAAR